MNSRAASERGAGSGGDSVLGGPHRLLQGPTDLEDPGCVYVGPTQKVLGRRVPTLFMSGWVRAVLVTLSALAAVWPVRLSPCLWKVGVVSERTVLVTVPEQSLRIFIRIQNF